MNANQMAKPTSKLRIKQQDTCRYNSTLNDVERQHRLDKMKHWLSVGNFYSGAEYDSNQYENPVFIAFASIAADFGYTLVQAYAILQFFGYRDVDGVWDNDLLKYGCITYANYISVGPMWSIEERIKMELVSPEGRNFFNDFFTVASLPEW